MQKWGGKFAFLRRRLAEPAKSQSNDKHTKHEFIVPAIQYQASQFPASPNKMPIIHNFALPKAIGDLAIPAGTDAFFIAFLASKDPQTNKPWCPDVVAALPTLESTFTGANKPQAAFVEVGQRPEYDHSCNAMVEDVC